ncbi:MAG: DUF1592 domain-containing protein [Gemmataceae bacterium]|nr:DUF1592 domain-containing protein [Gemmataceae bacterium]
MPWRQSTAILALGMLCVAGWQRWKEPGAVTAAEGTKPAAHDFVRDGLGFIQKHCLQCHGEKAQKAGLSLHGYRDEASVMKGRKVWDTVVKMVQSGEMPPRDRPRPSAEEIEGFAKAVQGVYVRNSKPDPGHVTIRRLNRNEYNNTIRDLLGLDFNPAENFPADGVGYGFDNIGDVLSLSPILLEGYLTAAESVVRRVHVTAQRGTQISAPGYHLFPATDEARKGMKDYFRRLATKGQSAYLRLPASQDGEYVFRGRIYGSKAGDEPVRAAVLVNGKEVQTFEVKADSAKGAENFEQKVQVPSTGAEVSVGLALANEYKDDKGERVLWVESLTLVPPADCRPAAQRRLFPVDTAKSRPQQTEEMLARLATQAYRRPATADEVARLVKFVETSVVRGVKWETAMQRAVQAVLVSPKFLFRIELDDRPDSVDPHPIDEHQLASRLSYFVWSSMPDEELFALAGKKQLTANLDGQVRRMLQDPKARSLVDHFAMQWLQLGRLQLLTPDPKVFPTFNEPLRKAMLRETELFMEAIMREDRSILEIIDADFTFLNEPLARHYGIADTNGNRVGQGPARAAGQSIRGDQFQRVRLADGERGGILTQASILTATSNSTRTSPVKRGHWVLEQILGTPPPPPPPDVPALPDTAKAIVSGSLRQRLEQHRANPNCANCHARIDPIGFAFENYNAIGAYRTRDGEFLIDPSGKLPDGKTFQGPGELKAILKDKKKLFSRCLTEKMLTYALGRGVEFYDQPTVDRIAAALGRNEHKFSLLVTEIARSDPFRLRRGKELAK